ncbi:MAG: diaminopimelate epimerase [Pseudomonadota bacterium]
MRLHFTKMHGAGNDFVIFDARQARPADHCEALNPDAVSAGFFRAVADRREGIGCDQVLVLQDAGNDDAVARYRVFNADGGEVQQCGNGARCLARYVADTGTVANEFDLHSVGGVVSARVAAAGIDNDDTRVAVSLGVPDFEPKALPLLAEQREPQYAAEVNSDVWRFGAVSMGNPHAVLMVDDPATAPVTEVGSAFNNNPMFPEGVNVGFARVDASGALSLRVFERGVGETRACGTGAAAAAAVAIDAGLAETEVTVKQSGGQLVVSWPSPGALLWLAGPAVRVFEGFLDV